jgi:hypothetical protein
MKVYICSPYQGSEANLDVARQACGECLNNGDAPFASHLLYPNIGRIPRRMGLDAALQWVRQADMLWVITMDGTVTSGMAEEIATFDASVHDGEYKRVARVSRYIKASESIDFIDDICVVKITDPLLVRINQALTKYLGKAAQ